MALTLTSLNSVYNFLPKVITIRGRHSRLLKQLVQEHSVLTIPLTAIGLVEGVTNLDLKAAYFVDV
jgi:hypothetical protein